MSAMNSVSSIHKEPIAIIGISCCFPGAVNGQNTNGPDDFWNLLMNKVDAIGDVPSDRWDNDSLYHPDPDRGTRISVHQGGFIRDIERFDAAFFGIPPVEAVHIDPQQRTLLEQAYMALEDAGLQLGDLSGSKTGVFIGISSHDYGDIQFAYGERLNLGPHTVSGIASSVAANRISYVFNLKGPSLCVDTACSSSLAATHLACQSIWTGESTLVLVGGVNIILKPEPQIAFSKGGFLAPDGRCKSFDASADGYVRSEGAGVVVLKPLSKAVEDRDNIYATIIGSAINQDGHTIGISMPNLDSQISLLQEAYRDAGISPSEVNYIEAHGTGTAVGDPIEANAIGTVVGSERAKGEYCLMGSVKSNIGHLEPASGIAGLIKAALLLRNREVPPNIHFENPNPKIPFEHLHLKVPTEIVSLPDNGPVYAGVNSFGFAGTNVHVVLKSAPEMLSRVDNQVKKPSREMLFTLTARSEPALRRSAQKYIDFLSETGDSLADICYTNAVRRSTHDFRLTTAAHSREELADHLEAFTRGEDRIGMSTGQAGLSGRERIAFVYSGQGPQWWAMGRELLSSNSLFRDTIEKLDLILSDLGWLKEDNSSLIQELTKDEVHSRIDETQVAQLTIFATQIALTEIWKSWRITPDAVVGHSLGESAASYVAGILSLEEAARVVVLRSRCQSMQRGRGRMLAVGLSEEEAQDAISGIEDKVCIASINGPAMVALSGDSTALSDLSKELEQKDIFNRFLRLDIPFHSQVMDAIRDDFFNELGHIEAHAANIKYYSAVTAEEMSGTELGIEYWYRHLREPVRFYRAIRRMVLDGFNTFVEISPHPVLAEAVMKTLSEIGNKGLIVPSLRREEGEMRRMLSSLGELFVWGYPADLSLLFNGSEDFVKVPSYPWQKERYWLETEEGQQERLGGYPHPHLVKVTDSATDPDTFVWTISLDKRIYPYIGDHKLQGPIVYPGAGHIDLAIAVGKASFGERFGFLEDINFELALFLPAEGDPPSIQFEVSSVEGTYVIASKPKRPGAEWLIHSRGRINHIGDRFASKPIDLNAIRARLTGHLDHESISQIYDMLNKAGLQLGNSLKGINQMWWGEMESLGEIIVPKEIQEEFHQFNIHPAVLDACFQSLVGSIMSDTADNATEKSGVYIPYHIDRVKFHQNPVGHKIWSYGRATKLNEEQFVNDIWLVDEEGNLFAEFQGFVFQYLKGSKGEVAGQMDAWFYEYQWQMKPRLGQDLRRNPEEYLPSPTTLQPLVEKLNEIPDPLNKKYREVYEPELNSLCVAYIISALRDIGLPLKEAGEVLKEGLMQRCGVLPRHERLFHRLLSILEAQGYMRKSETGWTKTGKPMNTSPSRLMQQIKDKYPEFRHEVELLARCGPRLRDVLQGKADPAEVLFPETEPESLFHFYACSYGLNKYNEMMHQILDHLLMDFPEEQSLRVLEIGAGTGGMSQALLPLFPPERTEYFFTDLSPMFLVQAKRRFAHYPFIRYSILDIEQEPQDQEIEPYSYDLVIASDVLHATRNIRETLGNARKFLAPGGILAMLEVTVPPIYADLTFGMTEGWWLYEDTDIRKDHCTLPLGKWRSLLEESDFTDILSATDAQTDDQTSQTIFLARNADQETRIDEVTIPDKEPSVGKWLVYADQRGVSESFITRLKASGGSCCVIVYGDTYKRIDDQHFCIDPHSPEQMHEAMATLLASNQLQGIIHFWSVDEMNQKDMTGLFLEECQVTGSISVVNIIKELVAGNLEDPPHVWLITAGAETPTEDYGEVSIAQVTLWGTARVIRNEYPEIPVSIVDLSSVPDEDELDSLFKEVTSLPLDEREDELAFRGKRRYRHKFSRVNPKVAEDAARKSVPATGYPYNLETREPTVLDNLILRETHNRGPGQNEVSIDVCAAALNFRDVMIALGILADEAIAGGFAGCYFGLECAGRIRAVGPNVASFSVGDEVVAITPDGGAIGGIAIAHENFVIRKPEHLSMEEVVTIPIVYLTAYYSLNHLCQMTRGERVLIHAAAGGVGLAAVRLAQHAGAEILATSSEGKHEFLRSLGIKYVFDSRSPDLKDQIMAATDGKGVDIVLNSIAGKMVTQSLKCLAPYGRFVELGKVDIYRNARIGLQPFGRNLAYFGFDINRLFHQKPEFVGRLLREIMSLFQSQALVPHPYSEFPVSQVVEAFRYLAQAKHIGKVILTMKEPEVSISPPVALSLEKDATYLIVGGCSGFGLASAAWMATKGAGHLVLMSRSGPRTEEDRKAVDKIISGGTNVSVMRGDVTNYDDVMRVFNEIKQSLPPLKGILQSAMVLEDATLLSMDAERFMRVIRPKMSGTWNLHRASLSCPLDFFLMFSSISGLYGLPGQSNYAGASAFLDKFSYYRRAMGLPATTIDWGGIAEVGFAARAEKQVQGLMQQGWGIFSLKQSTAILERMILESPIVRCAMNVDWENLGRAFPHSASSFRFAHLYGKGMGSGAGSDVSGRLRNALMSEADDAEMQNILKAEVREAVARILGTSGSRVDMDVSLTRMGMDSLMANQLRSWIATEAGVDYSMMQILEGPNINELSQHLLQSIRLDERGKAPEHGETDKWIIRPVPRQEALIRMFCFPYIGAGASVFYPWIDALPKDIELCGVQFPGHGDRKTESPIEDDRELIAALKDIILRYNDKPFAFYGHSLGGLICFHLALELQKSGPLPTHVFIGAGPIPGGTTPLDGNSEIYDSEGQILDDFVLDLVRSIGISERLLRDEQWQRENMHIYRADVTLMNRLVVAQDGVLQCPLTAFAGSDDPVSPEHHMSWGNYTSNTFHLKVAPGGHFFLNEKEGQKVVLEHISDILLGMEEPVR